MNNVSCWLVVQDDVNQEVDIGNGNLVVIVYVTNTVILSRENHIDKEVHVGNVNLA